MSSGLINGPLVQAGLAPFLAGFAVGIVLFKLRLGGLAAAAGFCTTAWLIGELRFSPFAANQLMWVALSAPALGLLADLAFRPGRTTAYVLGVAYACAALWLFSGAIMGRPPVQAFIVGGGIALFVGWTVAMTASLHANSVRAGAAGVGLGIGTGIAVLLGLALGAASAGFLLAQMILGRRIEAGLAFSLAAGVQGALVAAAAFLAGKFGWLHLAIVAVVPLAARLPFPTRWPVWAQTFVACFYTAVCGGAAAATAHVQSRGWPSWLQ